MTTTPGARNVTCAVVVWAGVVMLPPADAQAEGPGALIDDAKLLLDSRLRYEFVDQEGFADDAYALTLRARLGLETGALNGFSALLEGDITRDLGISDFNSTVNGRTGFPVIADPDSQRINRAHVTYRNDRGAEGMQITLGRQRIKLDDDRFIGNVGFRQNEQTYDAARIQLTPADDLRLEYTYLWRVNRIFGSRSRAGDESADSHLVRVAYDLAFGELSAHAYLLDLDGSLARASNRTFGGRFRGERALDDTWRLSYGAAYSTQRDHGNNPDSFSLDYWQLEGELHWANLTLSVAQEVLEGNGERGFATPLATLHAFQGFADVFVATPAAGIRDRHVALEVKLPASAGPGRTRVFARYHDFDARRGSGDLGRELNLGVYFRPLGNMSLSLEYADFSGADARPDVSKFWAAFAFNL